MLAAKPVDNTPSSVLDVPRFEADASVSAATGDFTPGNVTAFPQRVHGKVFFLIGNDTFTCSGTLIDSARRNVVFTAGHCIYDHTAGAFAEQMAFVPGYENGDTPYGIIYGTRWFTTPQWIQNRANSYDIGVMVLESHAQNSLGARQIAFDQDPRGKDYTLYGYPSRPNPPFDGEVLQGCRSAVIGQDNEQGSVVRFPALDAQKRLIPFALAARPCHMQQGSSGGGWTFGNYVNSVVSYGYCDNFPASCGIIFGPYFSNAAKALYTHEQVGGSSAPTVRILRAPPRIVRKRAVSFRLSGRGATPLAFIYRLNRQKPVRYSERISIKRLRPGRHTLRIRSVDQTGRTSRRQIVRSFRVVVPRNARQRR